MRLRLPVVPVGFDAVQRLSEALEREMIHAVDVREAVPHLLLLSPGGIVFKLTVNDAGALTATRVQG